MKANTAVIVSDIYENYDNDFTVLVPNGIISGIVKKDEQGEYIENDKVKIYRFNGNNNADQCYIFPLNIETLYEEYLDITILEKVNYIEKDYIDEVINYYLKEVSDNVFYSKYDVNDDVEVFYRVDIYNNSITEIDSGIDFWKACSNELIVTKENKAEPIDEKITQDFDYKKVTSDITRVVKGQDEPLDQILVSVKKHLLSDGKLKSNMLITGESGCGKTEIFVNLSKSLGINYVIADATKFTQEGYSGDNVGDMLYQLYQRSGKNLKVAEHSILIVDEIDKKANKNERELVSSKGVLDSLLKIMEGSKIYVNSVGEFDTSKLIFVALGAFEGIKKEDKVMGFNLEKGTPTNKILQTEDFVKYGLTTEFVGRFNSLITLNHLTFDNLVDILLNSEKSNLKINQDFLTEYFKIRLQYDDDYISEVVKASEKLKIGARGLNRVVEQSLFQAMKEILESDIKNKELIVTKETVINPKSYILK